MQIINLFRNDQLQLDYHQENNEYKVSVITPLADFEVTISNQTKEQCTMDDNSLAHFSIRFDNGESVWLSINVEENQLNISDDKNYFIGQYPLPPGISF